MNPLIIVPNIIFIVPLAVNLSLSSIPRRRNWAVEPYLMYSAISSTLGFTLSWLLFLPPRQLNACWVLQIHCKDEKFLLMKTIIVHIVCKVQILFFRWWGSWSIWWSVLWYIAFPVKTMKFFLKTNQNSYIDLLAETMWRKTHTPLSVCSVCSWWTNKLRVP